ncbi:hypothetical protein IVB18_31610 [Bradyrhizobium sp. 186]|uniref:hypothetical protein n=1 Tax=Bradyrhizobium sp. 186 TaxID=2782654 RepID=UPI002000E16F|nr:hypothetical protein [Bradyrhizobium sp. 186]UPK32784.1 hypothetical protein IVB18_31610 [Bradyrhizobium sp. 186]
MFNTLDGGVCATCAPGDQEKSSDSEFEQSSFDPSELMGAVQVASTEKRILFVGMVSGPVLGRWVGQGANL